MLFKKLRDNLGKPSGALIQDIGQLAGGAVSLVEGLREELKRDMQERLEALVSRLDLVPRKDFERLEAMVMKMRAEQEAAKKTTVTKTESKTDKKTSKKPVKAK